MVRATKKNTKRNVKRSHRKNKRRNKVKSTRRNRYGGMKKFSNPFGYLSNKVRTRRERRLRQASPIDEEAEIVNLEEEARRKASGIYQEFNSKEFITGQYGQRLYGIRDKQQKACEEAKAAIIEDPQYGRNVWVLIANEFPCPFGLMPEEEAERLGKIISPESWNEIIQNKKGGKTFRDIFIRVFFTNFNDFHVKPRFIRMEYTNKELERMINDIVSPSEAPIENKYLVDNPKALPALIKTIQTLSKMLNMKISNAILRHAKIYWIQNNDYSKTKNYIKETFGEVIWKNIEVRLKQFIEDFALKRAKNYWVENDNYISTKNYVKKTYGETVWKNIEVRLKQFIQDYILKESVPGFVRTPPKSREIVDDYLSEGQFVSDVEEGDV